MISRTVPGVFLNCQEATKLFNAAGAVIELTEWTQDDCEGKRIPDCLLQIVDREFNEVI